MKVSKNITDNIFIFSMIIALLFYIIMSIYNQVFSMFILLSYVFLVFSFLPIKLCNGEILHPLVINSPFLIFQSIKVALISLGIIPLQSIYNLIGDNYTLEFYYLKTIIITIFGLTVMYFFAFVKIWPRGKPFNYEIKNSKPIGYLIFFISITSFIIIVYRVGSLEVMIKNMINRGQLYSGLSYFIFFTSYLVVVSIIYLLRGETKKSIFFLVLQMIMGFFLGDRSYIILSALFPYIIFWIYYKGKRRDFSVNFEKLNIQKIVLIGLVSVLFYQFLGNYRLYGTFQFADGSFVEKVISFFQGIIHFDNSVATVYLTDKILDSYLYFKPLINIIFAPIPRGIWPGKPETAESALIGNLITRSSKNLGLPPGLYAYGYINFGLIGTFLFAMLNGIVINIIYYKLIKYYYIKNLKIPSGNLLAYTLVVFSLSMVVSTEAQIKILMALPVLLISLKRGAITNE